MRYKWKVTTMINVNPKEEKYFWELVSFLVDNLRDYEVNVECEGGIITLTENVEGTYYPAFISSNGDGTPEDYSDLPNIMDDYIEELVEEYVAGYEYDVLFDWNVKMEIKEYD